jgi:predicted protein tyrosine phosphatase
VPAVIEQTGASRLVSAINSELLPETPGSIRSADHLKLDMHDITEAAFGTIPPALEHVMELLDFVQSWDQTAPMVIHCYAGLSRSTAAAYISLCTLNPNVPEETIARALRRSSATAIPNRLFVDLADRALRRDGRMLEALRVMGPHRAAYEGVPFELEARHAEAGDDTRAESADAARRPRLL